MEYIPDVLYVQMDNCWRENKNQFVIIFLAVLIKYKVFKKVHMNVMLRDTMNTNGGTEN